MHVMQPSTQIYCFFNGDFVRLEDAKVGVMTHALNYGTGVFEGLRGYWNAQDEELYIFRMREHYVRFLKNTAMMFINVPYTADELCDITLDLLRRDHFSTDTYIRPLAYKSSEQIGVSMEGVEDALTIFAVPYGDYVPMDRPLTLGVSSWLRSDDNAIPGRAKVSGNYVNTALAKNEAVRNGYDEAVVLNRNGYVVEGSAENIFLVRDGVLVTPSVADGILEGITRATIMKLAEAELGVKTVERNVARTELYYAEEIFMTGTGAQVATVSSVDGRKVGDGKVGPITRELQKMYFDVVKGYSEKYRDWLTPVAAGKPAPAPATVS
jgi:branched-chain amino acid aminotransferase